MERIREIIGSTVETPDRSQYLQKFEIHRILGKLKIQYNKDRNSKDSLKRVEGWNEQGAPPSQPTIDNMKLLIKRLSGVDDTPEELPVVVQPPVVNTPDRESVSGTKIALSVIGALPNWAAKEVTNLHIDATEGDIRITVKYRT